MLALRLLWRNWRSGEVRLLAVALIIAVAVVSSIAIFTDRLDRTLVRESNMLLGADALVRSSYPLEESLQQLARQQAVQTSHAVVFSSMVYAGDAMQLASVKAVEPVYPLRGELEISQQPFAVDRQHISLAAAGPAPGEVWLDSRLFPLLDINPGDSLTLGDRDFRGSQVLIREPDGGNPFSFMGGPRLLMHLDDLPSTGVVQPGSRVEYQWLLAGEAGQVDDLLKTLKPLLNEHQRIVTAGSSNRGMGRTLETGKQFLMLSAVIGVLLAGVAIALASQQFASRHVDQVALLKSLGMSAAGVRRIYTQQLLWLAIGAAIPGLVVGELVQQGIASGLEQAYQIILAAPGFYPYLISFLGGLLCLICFALPALWFLPRIPPLRILRRDMQVPVAHTAWRVGMAVSAVALLVLLFSRDIQLAISVSLGMVAIVLIACGICWLFLRAGQRVTQRRGSIWRIAIGNMQRHREQTLIQLVVFATALMLVLVLVIVRTSMLKEWQMQMPERMPNHFLVNMAPQDVEPIQKAIDTRRYEREQLYPMVRGRLLEINGEPPSDEQRAAAGVFHREANLTWTDILGEDNRVVEGLWWNAWQPRNPGLPGVSVEVELAREAGLKIGDRLGFSLGGLRLEAEIASFRSLDWRSMKPNFFFIFEPGALDNYSPTYITSLYLPPQDKAFINELLRAWPTMLVIELDRIMAQIRSVVQHISDGVQLVLWLIMAASILVLLAAVNGSLDTRRQEAGLLRALGSPGRLIVGGVWAEFSLIGCLAGVIAVLGAEVLLLSLQRYVLDIPVTPHYLFWVAGPLLGALLVGSLGAWSCRSVVQTPPAIVLREAG